jgi:hypothetical protein
MHVRRRTDAYLIPGEPPISVQLITNLPSGSVAPPPGVVNSMPSPWVLCIKRDRRTTRKERLSNCMRLCICYNEQTNANANEARLGWCETTVKFRHASSSVVGGETEHGGGGAARNKVPCRILRQRVKGTAWPPPLASAVNQPLFISRCWEPI